MLSFSNARNVLRTCLLALVGVGFLALSACSDVQVDTVEAAQPVTAPEDFDHSAFTTLLETYVNERGLVDYAALKAEGLDELNAYLQSLAATDPSNLSRDEQLAFWINAYNAYTLKLIAESYPVESIRDAVGGVFVPLVNSPWKARFAVVGGETYTLNEIEHEIIRPNFDEPRIHFAVNCAALSCPKLRQEAYVGARLDAQLEDQAQTFLHNEARNQIPAGEGAIKLSKIFDWYGGDFGEGEAAIQDFLAPYFEGEVRRKLEAGAYEIEFLDYDWSLNEQSGAE